MKSTTASGGGRWAARGAAAALGLVLVLVTWPGGDDGELARGLERGARPALEPTPDETTLLPATAPANPAEARAPVEAPEPAAAMDEPEAPTVPPRRLRFCDGAPATELEFKLPGGYDRGTSPTTSDAAGNVHEWPEQLNDAWLRLTGAVLGSGSGNGAYARIENGDLELGVRRVPIEPLVPAGLGSRRVKLSASMPVPHSDELHRCVTSIGADAGSATFFAPCDRPFTVDASIERAGPDDPDYYGSVRVAAGASSDVVLPLTLTATYRGEIRVEDPSGALNGVGYTLTCTAPYGRYRKKGLLVGETYPVPPGDYTVRLDVDALAARPSEQRVVETVLTCGVGSGLGTVVPLQLEPAARLRVHADPGAHVLREDGTVRDLGQSEHFRVELLRDGKGRIPTRWFGFEEPDPVTCKAGHGPFTSSALRPGEIHVVFYLRGSAVGDPVEVQVGPGETIEVVMPVQ